MSISQDAISFEKASIGYNGIPVLSDLDLHLKEGESLALVGGNGSGKSTLLKTVAGLIPLLCGKARVLGGRPGSAALRLAYHGQFHPRSFLLPLRSIDVVRMARFPHRGLLHRLTAEDEAIVREALATLEAEDLADLPVDALSGGQRQRVFLAHTLAKQGTLILLDEPTAGLDVAGIRLYEKVIGKLKKERNTLVIATHRFEEAAQCDQVLLLASRMVAFGTPSQVMTQENLLSTFGLHHLQDSAHEKEHEAAV